MNKKCIVVLSCLFGLMGGCDPEEGVRLPVDVPDEPLPQVKEATCFTDDLLSLDARCGYLYTSDDHQVAYARLPALDEGSNSDLAANAPLVFLIGGPGASSLVYAPEAFIDGNPYDYMRRGREVILLDYRSVGFSTPFPRCAQVDDNSESICYDLFSATNVDPQAIRSKEFARDVVDILRAHGFKQAIVLGESYGTRVALTMLRDFPQYVSHAVLDGLFPPEVAGLMTYASEFAFSAYAAARAHCSDSGPCHAAYGDLRDLFAQIKPEQLAALGRENGLDAIDYLFELMSMAYEPTFPAVVYHLVQELTQEPGSDPERTRLLQRIIPTYQKIAYEDPESISTGFFSFSSDYPPFYDIAYSDANLLGVLCAEEYAFEEQQRFDPAPYDAPEEIAQAFNQGPDRFLGASFVRAKCETLDIPGALEIEMQAVSSDKPILIISGGADFQTPYTWVEKSVKTLPNAKDVFFPSRAHVVGSRDACARSVIGRFVQNPAGYLDTNCVPALQAPRVGADGQPLSVAEIAADLSIDLTSTARGPGPAVFNERSIKDMRRNTPWPKGRGPFLNLR